MILQEDLWLLILCFVFLIFLSMIVCIVPEYINELDNQKKSIVLSMKEKNRKFLLEHFWIVSFFFHLLRTFESIFLFISLYSLSSVLTWVISAHRISIFTS